MLVSLKASSQMVTSNASGIPRINEKPISGKQGIYTGVTQWLRPIINYIYPIIIIISHMYHCGGHVCVIVVHLFGFSGDSFHSDI